MQGRGEDGVGLIGMGMAKSVRYRLNEEVGVIMS